MIGPMDENSDRRRFRDLVVRRWRALLRSLALIVLAVALVVILVSTGGDDGFAQVDPDNPTRTYFFVFLLVAADAVIPVFPGETTLNAASTFAADGDLELWLVIVLGADNPTARAGSQELSCCGGARLPRPRCSRAAGVRTLRPRATVRDQRDDGDE
jgi:hypothetical protein